MNVTVLLGAVTAMWLAVSPPTGAHGQGPVEIPFDFVRNQIVVEVRLNRDGPFFFMLDTMGSPSAVDVAAARRAGLPLDTTRVGSASGAGGERIPIYPSAIVGLELGGSGFGDVPAIALDLAPIAGRLGHRLDGILGVSFLRDRVVQIDYPARMLRIYGDPQTSPALSPAGAGWLRHQVPMVLRGTDPLITNLRVNGSPLVVTLDTGSSLTLEIYANAIDQLGLTAEFDRAVADSVRGARGMAEVFEARVDSLGLGDVTLTDQPVTFTRELSDRGGSLGNGFLRHFVLTLDYVNRLIAFDYRP